MREGSPLTIGQLAQGTGVPAKTIRYYEGIGLLPTPARGDNGYRSYDERAAHTLRFVKRARDLGFSIAEVQELLALWQDPGRASGEVKAIARKHIDEVENKLAELEGMRRTLMHLVHRCHGDNRPDCPILEDLAHGRQTKEEHHGNDV
jgi:Cu(I)-responsive transcriptional regulator